jgi:hypothetical protein
MTNAGTQFRSHQEKLTNNLCDSIQAYATSIQATFNYKALHQMERGLDAISGDILMFGLDRWPNTEDQIKPPSRRRFNHLMCAAGIMIAGFTSLLTTTTIVERNPNHTLSSFSTYKVKCGEYLLQRA